MIFYEEAKIDLPESETSNLRENLQKLKRLALVNLADPRPLRLFVTGPAGAGKSKLLDEVIAYCKQFSNNIGHNFTKYTIRITALTGSAACEIGGNTTASEYLLCAKKSSRTRD